MIIINGRYTFSHILIILNCFCFYNILPKENVSSLEPLYEKIAQENLKAVIKEIETSGTETLAALIDGEKEFYQLLEESLAKSLSMPKIMKRAAIFNLFSEYEMTYKSLRYSDVLDEVSWKDLELLCGPKTTPELCIANQIDRTSTEAGRAVLYHKIIQPLSNINEINNQQHTIKMLLEHEKFFNIIDKKLKELSKTEDVILSFFGEDLFHSILLQEKITIIGQNTFTPLKTLSNWLNKNEMFLEIITASNMVLNTLHDVRNAIGSPLLCAYGISQATGITPPQLLKKYSIDLNLGEMSKFFIFGSFVYVLRWAYKSPITDGFVNISDGLVGLQRAYWRRNNIKTNIIFIHGLQTKLINVATYINNMKYIVKIASENEELATLPMITNLKNTFLQLSNDPDIHHLFNLLSTKTFKDKASSFSYQGRVLSAYKLMHELKYKLTPLIAAIGELDAQMSIARLYKEFQEKDITFCFPVCIDEEIKPAIKAINFWNPIIDAESVIANTISLGEKYNHCNNIAVSGPNAGGKTTITVRGLPICIILAQSLGIAPAQSLYFTPFQKIITYLNITDDIAQGNSKFTAGVERALQVLNIAEQSSSNNFILAAIDEALDGATYEESQAAAYSLFEAIGKCDHAMCLTTTHLPLVYELENIGTFANYKVSAHFDEYGKLYYPYKLEAGRANQNIVFNVLNEKGFSSDFVNRSSEILTTLKGKIIKGYTYD